ncbi:nitrilase-related carbon-nitrogen hydrolase [Streptomyces sp. NPDC001204]
MSSVHRSSSSAWLPAAVARATAAAAPGGGSPLRKSRASRLGLAVCRDTGIPEHAARTAALGIDGYVAGVVHADHEAEVHGERARRVAADHGAWVATAAFAGPTGGGFDRTSGRSGIWSADGELVAEASSAPDEIARAVFMPEGMLQPAP